MFCPRCGSQQTDGAAACVACGSSLAVGGSLSVADPAPIPPEQQMVFAPQNALAPQVPVMPPPVAAGGRNPMAVAGFVCGLLGLTPFWVGCVLCVLAITFSAIGMARSGPLGGVGRGLAIAGLVLGVVFLPFASCGL